MIEPVDPFERGIFDGFERSPGTAPVDDLGLVKTVDRLGQSVVITVADIIAPAIVTPFDFDAFIAVKRAKHSAA